MKGRRTGLDEVCMISINVSLTPKPCKCKSRRVSLYSSVYVYKMSEYGYAISWFTLSPLGVVTDVLAIVVITHYFPFFHGTDVTLISLMVAMAGNAMFVITIPAFLEIKNQQWSSNLCYGYVWCVLTIRVSQMLSLMVLSVHWSTLLKLSAQKKRYVSTKYLKFTVVFIWVLAAFFGAFPLLGAANKDFNTETSCNFLAFNLGTGYALFFLIINSVVMLVSIICCCDSMMLIREIKNTAGNKYQTDRFQLPDRRADLPMHAGSSMAERYHRLKFAWDLSKFAVIFTILTIALDILPYTIIQGLQLFTDVDRRTVEVVSLYLVAFEALLLPQTLWLLSRRYRHALTYQWKVYILRNKDIEEDEPTACTLQSYISRERDRISLAPSRPASVIAYSAPGTIRSMRSETLPRPKIQIHSQLSTSPVTTNDTIGRLTTVSTTPSNTNGVIKGEVYVERPPSLYDERPIDVNTLDIAEERRGYLSDSNLPVSDNRRNHLHQDVKRSASSGSKQNIKDQIKRKHLPSIFINEGYESGDKSPSTEEMKLQDSSHEGSGSGLIGNASNYYMSSDYHPDCLTNSLPRNKLRHAPSTESEGSVYRNEDIEEVLSKSAFQRHYPNVGGTLPDRTSSFRTFKQSPELPRSNVQKSVYSTFDDLSKMGDMRTENELEFENDVIELDEMPSTGSYNWPIAIRTNPTSHRTYTTALPERNLTSFKPDESTLRHTLPKHVKLESGNLRSSRLTSSNTDDVVQYSPYKCVPQEIQAIANMRLEQTSFSNRTDGKSKPYSNHKAQNQLYGQSQTIVPSVVLDPKDNSIDDENASSNSSGSVTISPYKEGGRRRPWLDDVDSQIDEHSQMGDPLVADSDTETLRDLQEGFDRFAVGFDNRHLGYNRSELSTPVSSIFDEETDRGFEDALDIHINTNGAYSGVGLCFESIKEEPEDTGSYGSNPFLANDNGDNVFRTHAVMSSRSNSRTSSCTSVCDNPFSTSPSAKVNSPSRNIAPTPTIAAIDDNIVDFEFGDSGFTSSHEKGNASDSSGHQDISLKDRTSPWPDDSYTIPNTEMTFESNFCRARSDRFKQFNNSFANISVNRNDSGITGDFRAENESSGASNTFPTSDGRRPYHKALEAIKLNNRPMPQRVRSFERQNSPVHERRLPKRGHSFETDRSDVKPAYF